MGEGGGGAGSSREERGLSNIVLLLFLLPPYPFAQILQRVHLVLSVSSDASLGETLEQSQDARVVALGPLEPSARARLVREELALYGKRLEESPFNNQVDGGQGWWVCGVNVGAERSRVLRLVAAPHRPAAASFSQELCARGRC